jgi:hypothetical protein
MSQSNMLYDALDVHKESIAVAYVAREHHAEVDDLGTIGAHQCDRETLRRTLHSQSTHLVCIDEAGPVLIGSVATSPKKPRCAGSSPSP